MTSGDKNNLESVPIELLREEARRCNIHGYLAMSKLELVEAIREKEDLK